MAFTCDQRIDWGDCDEAGLVFYPNYFRWMDAAFHRLCAAAGHSQRSLRRDHGVYGTPLVNASCGFTAPATYGETLQIETEVSRWGESSMTLAYRFNRHGEPIATGCESRVFARRGPEGIGKTAIPPTVRATLEQLLGR